MHTCPYLNIGLAVQYYLSIIAQTNFNLKSAQACGGEIRYVRVLESYAGGSF